MSERPNPNAENNPRVAVVIETYAAFGQALVRGLLEAHERRPGWSFELVARREVERVTAERLAGYDAVMAQVRDDAVEAMLRSLGVPVVAVTGDVKPGGLPRVTIDQAAVGRMAAEDLLGRGFERFAFAAWRGKFYSDARYEGYRRRLEREDCPCEIGPGEGEGLEAWLTSLTAGGRGPVAVFAANDELGARVVRTLGRLGVRVPEEVAVMGVDNDRAVCRLVHPPLSSIETGNERVGARAVELLERLLGGDPPPDEPITVEPLEVVTRQSTDTVAVDHPEAAAALKYIRDHACEGIGVGDVLKAVPAARRTLEYQFKRRLGRTMHGEIRRVQIDRAKRLLTHTEMAMPDITEAIGLGSASQLSVAFRRATGETPIGYRKRSRAGE